MKRLLTFVGLALVLGLSPLAAADDESSAKTALQALNDFIGDWKGSGAPEKRLPDPRDTWRETVSWGWRFKGNDVWLTMTVKGGKYLKSGELRYLPDKKRYQLTAVDAKDKKLTFEGTLSKDGRLILDRLDPATKDTQRLTMYTAADGVRFLYLYSHRPEDRTLFTKDYQVACTKEGESLAAKEKKIECVVSGGLGKTPVSYNGTTYYVCCSGCLDAFKENPEKYVKEFEAKKKKK
jgi:hypothetical protein